jgi:glycine cleavage system H lipoate-binding protein
VSRLVRSVLLNFEAVGDAFGGQPQQEPPRGSMLPAVLYAVMTNPRSTRTRRLQDPVLRASLAASQCRCLSQQRLLRVPSADKALRDRELCRPVGVDDAALFRISTSRRIAASQPSGAKANKACGLRDLQSLQQTAPTVPFSRPGACPQGERRLNMVVLLVLATFLILILIDYLLHRGQVAAVVAEPKRGLVPAFDASLVGGFVLRGEVAYHPGHTWAMDEGRNIARIGLDDFAVKLLGKVESMVLPQLNRWIRQGQKIFTFTCHGKTVEMLSPIEGEVIAINRKAIENPDTVSSDPYGKGWLLAVKAPQIETNLKNLLTGRLAVRWMEEASERLRSMLPQLAGAVAQDGGLPVSDILAHLDSQSWSEVTKEFFLS